MLWNLLHNIFILDDFAHIKRDYDPVFEDTRRRGLQPLTSAKYWKKPGALHTYMHMPMRKLKKRLKIPIQSYLVPRLKWHLRFF